MRTSDFIFFVVRVCCLPSLQRIEGCVKLLDNMWSEVGALAKFLVSRVMFVAEQAAALAAQAAVVSVPVDPRTTLEYLSL